MDKETEDAFKLLTSKIQDGFNNMATKQDIQGMATKQDIEIIRTDIKDLEKRIRYIVREEVQDIRKDIETRCSPSQTE